MDRDDQGRDGPVQPSHIAYHVRDGAEKPYFNRIGSAFEHKDGKGLNVLLDATPVDGRVTLRSNEERVKAARDGSGSRERQDRDRGRR